MELLIGGELQIFFVVSRFFFSVCWLGAIDRTLQMPAASAAADEATPMEVAEETASTTSPPADAMDTSAPASTSVTAAATATTTTATATARATITTTTTTTAAAETAPKSESRKLTEEPPEEEEKPDFLEEYGLYIAIGALTLVGGIGVYIMRADPSIGRSR